MQQPKMQQTGFRDTSAEPADDLRGRMSLSPTGRQLASDGSFVLGLYTADPADALISPPDGTCVLWNNSGTLTIAAFTRATGWAYRTLA